MRCPICERETRRLFRKDDCWICGCTGCGHQLAELPTRDGHVGRVYGNHYFQGDAAGYADYVGEARLLCRRGQMYARLLRPFIRPGRVLDIGAAAGFLLQGFCSQGWQGVGLEPNPAMAAHARVQLGLDVRVTDLESWHAAEQFDLVSMIQVVAHFHDLRRALEIAAEATKPGGFWLIETWNRASWTARLFGWHWHEYSPPSVLHWFTPTTLRRLLGRYGLREVALGSPTKRLSGAHARLLLRPRLTALPGGRLLLPLLGLISATAELPYPAEDLFWGLYQKK